MRSRLALLLWCGGLAAAIAALTALGHGDLGAPPLGELSGWVEDRGGVVAAFAIIRLLALGAAWYLLGATVLGVVVRLVGAAAAMSALDAVTVPAVQRLLHSAMAAGITLGAVTPAAAPLTRVALIAEAAPEPVPATATMRLIEEAPPAPPAQAPAPPHSTYVVQPGDHLWAIAERVVGERLGRAPTDAEVVPYWRALIELNQPPNPDLIFAGDVLRLPD